ncbi:MAG TPA: ABC transporter ATP-binding protein [Pseudogracilibacillus sp.]|nr:ABC transporter ATP-binding protein [Pseudogracilibacillus sp.]
MQTIIKFLKPYKLHIIIAYALTFVELVADLLFPLFLGIIINTGIMEQNEEAIISWGTLMLIITAITFASGIANSFYASHISVRFAYQLREELFAHIQTFTYAQLAKFPSSAIVTRFTNDVRQVQNTIFMALRIMTRAPFMVIGSVIMALIVNVKIASIFLITVPVLLFFLYFVLVKGSAMFKTVQQRVDRVNQTIQENIAGMRTIRSFVRSQFENNRFMKANKALAKDSAKAFRFVEASMPVLLFGMNIGLLFILWFGHSQVMAGSTNVGDVVTIINYALRTVMAISMFTFIALAFSRAKASIERIDLIFNEETTAHEVALSPKDTDKKLEENIKGEIEFRNVTFQYDNAQRPTLEKVSFSIKPVEKLAIIGATGSGKTTLVQLIPRLYEATEGDVLIDGKPIEAYPVNSLRNRIGYVPQSPLLFTGTIRDNITFGKQEAKEEEVVQAAKDAQIHDTIMEFPKGYDTLVGQRGITLSGGQQQRLSIARALIRKPSILILDDSTSALDLQTEARLLKAIERYECTMLNITQKISTAKQADRILLLDSGTVVGLGTHEELLAQSTLYQRIVSSQSEEDVHAL